MKNLIIILISFFSIQCVSVGPKKYSKDILEKITDSNRKIAYVEYIPDANGIINIGFGKIVMFDVKNRTKIEFTNDNKINQSPSFSSDGKYIYFFSTRDADTKTVQILGESTQKKLYSIDIGKDDISRFKFPPEEKILEHDLSIKEFQQVNDSLFFFIVYHSIYSFNIKSNLVKLVYSVKDSNSSIMNYCIDFNKPILAINLKMDLDTSFSEVHIYDLQNKSERIIKNKNYDITLGNWSPKGEIFCYVGSLIHFYNYDKDTALTINMDHTYSLGIKFENAYFISNNELVLLGAIKDKTRKATGESYDLYLLNLTTNELKQLTNDGNLKDQISVYYRRN